MLITGTGLGTVTAVDFGSTPATAFAALSATEVVATSPPGQGTVDVTVTGTGGTSAVSHADLFYYADVGASRHGSWRSALGLVRRAAVLS